VFYNKVLNLRPCSWTTLSQRSAGRSIFVVAFTFLRSPNALCEYGNISRTVSIIARVSKYHIIMIQSLLVSLSGMRHGSCSRSIHRIGSHHRCNAGLFSGHPSRCNQDRSCILKCISDFRCIISFKTLNCYSDKSRDSLHKKRTTSISHPNPQNMVSFSYRS
jgi:hypothetical protein